MVSPAENSPANNRTDGHKSHHPADGGLAAPNCLQVERIKVEESDVGKDKKKQHIEKKKRTDPGTGGIVLIGSRYHTGGLSGLELQAQWAANQLGTTE